MTNVKTKVGAYAALWFVVLVWGCCPLVNVYLNRSFSPTVLQILVSFTAALTLLIWNIPYLKELNRDYFRIALVTGAFNAIASLVQKIGLLYTTPANYAFLENLSCVTVPLLVWILAKTRPTKLNLLTCVLCLVGSYIISGAAGISFSAGDMLCAAAGMLYGVNIAVTGIHAKKFRPSLYIFLQMAAGSVLSVGNALLLNAIQFNGAPIVPIQYSTHIPLLLVMAAYSIISNVVCWTLRTKAMQHIPATVVSVIAPLSAVVTAVLSVCLGTDTFSWQLLLGGGIGFLAAVLSSLEDVPLRKHK